MLAIYSKPSFIPFPRALLPLAFACIGVPAFSAPEVDNDFYLMLDANSYEGSIFSEESGDESGEEVFLRRAKYSLNVAFSDTFEGEFSAEYDEIEDEFKVKDLYLTINVGSNFEFNVGQFKGPAGLEKSQSLKYQYFMERSLATNIFTFPRDTGVRMLFDGNGWNLDVAAVQVDSKEQGYDDGLALSTRASVMPYRNEDRTRFIHLGANWSTRDGVERRFDINEPALAYSFGNTFRSPNYQADKVDTFGLEAAFSLGVVSLQTEVFNQSIDDRRGQTYEQDGYYTTATWTVFGNAREYRKGEIDLDKDIGKTLELAARVSHVDSANFGDGDVADVLTIALNYYPTRDYRFVLEYEQADIDSYDDGNLLVLDGSAVNARFQWVY